MEFAKLTWGQVASLPRETPVVLPIAAIEQHGEHLPLVTDSMLLEEILRRVKLTTANKVLFAPLLWLGHSDHHLDFAGTLSASSRLYLDLLVQWAENFLRHGFRRIVFVNGHGGNDVPARQALFELRNQYRNQSTVSLNLITYWNCLPAGHPLIGKFEQRTMGHACEWETSMMLRINPALVGNYQDQPTIAFGEIYSSPTVHRAWVTQDRTEKGHIGAPRFASAEKGELLLSAFAAGLSEALLKLAEEPLI